MVSRFSAVACASRTGAAAVAAVAVLVALASSAAAAPASCNGIGFRVLHNDQSGGGILPDGSYTVSSPNLGCSTASSYLPRF